MEAHRRIDWIKLALIAAVVILTIALVSSNSGRRVPIDRITRVEIDEDGDTNPEHLYLVGSIRTANWNDGGITLQFGPFWVKEGAATPTPFQ